jgi:AraC-like DNA-binding protein
MDTEHILSSALNLASGAVQLQGCLPENKGLPDKPRRLDAHAFVYVYSGNGHYMDENACSRRVSPGTLILLFPGMEHRYVADAFWSEVFFILKGPVLTSLEEVGLLDRRNPVLKVLPVEFWKGRLLDALPQTAPRSASAVARNFFNVLRLLVEMIDESHSGNKGDQQEKWLQRARQAIQQSLISRKEQQAIASALGESSPEAFRKRFTRLHGCSPGQYRYQLQIEQASLLLRSTNAGLKQIADRLGFYDVFHFSKRFKAGTGVSPSQFRQLYARSDPSSHP